MVGPADGARKQYVKLGRGRVAVIITPADLTPEEAAHIHEVLMLLARGPRK